LLNAHHECKIQREWFPPFKIHKKDVILLKFYSMTLISEQQLPSIVKRLANQILETYPGLTNAVIVGLQPRGVFLSDRIVAALHNEIPADQVQYGKLDITFYRDDVRTDLHLAKATDLPFSIEGKTVILIDDVLFTGRTIRAALDALLSFGRPSKVSLCVLVDRKPSRELPIQPDFTGKEMVDISPYKVKVRWKENDGVDDVILLVD
jgi:pyrimidine operon attenuation protein/uracil phosphoribosyltransferase